MALKDYLPLDQVHKAKFLGKPQTISKKKEFLLNYFHHGFVGQACKETGITRHLYNKWKREDEIFKSLSDEIVETRLDLAEMKLLSNINEGKETSLIFFLKTLGKSRGYVQNEVSQQQNETIDNNLLDKASDDDLIKLLN